MLNNSLKTLVMLVLVCGIFSFAGSYVGTNSFIPGPSAEVTLAQDKGEQWARAAGIDQKQTLLLIIRHRSLPASSPEFRGDAERILARFRQIRVTSDDAQPLFSTIAGADGSWLDPTLFESAGGHTALYLGKLAVARAQAAATLSDFHQQRAVIESEFPGYGIFALGNGLVDNEIVELIHRDLDKSLWYTLPLTLLVLWLSFGSLAAAIIPLVTAVVALVGALGLVAVLSHLISPISEVTSQLVVLLVLAIGVDYSLFIVSRLREELQEHGFDEALRRACANAGKAVLWSGVIVALSLAGLLILQDSILSSMATVSTAAVLFTALVTIRMVPALATLLQRHLKKSSSRRMLEATPRSWWVTMSVRRPLVALGTGLVLMGIPALFVATMRFGGTMEPAVFPPQMHMRQAFEILKQEFPRIAGVDMSVTLRAEKLAELEDEGALQPYIDQVLQAPTGDAGVVGGPFEIERSNDGSVMRYHLAFFKGLNDPDALATVNVLRQQIFPKLWTDLQVQAHLSGTLPFVIDGAHTYRWGTITVAGAVLVISMVLLACIFSSLVIPLKSMLLNVISTLAAFGGMVIIFQVAHLGGPQVTVIESFIPPLLYALLFGLSMDYHLFVLSRVQEEYRAGRSVPEAVAIAVQSTSSTITSAALIMVCVFVVMASLTLPAVKQLGVGLAIGVLLDATVVRSLVLPASMVLLGRWNWYLPRWLRPRGDSVK